MNKYRSKNKESYYLRSTLFNRIASDNKLKIGPSTVVEYVLTTCQIYVPILQLDLAYSSLLQIKNRS